LPPFKIEALVNKAEARATAVPLGARIGADGKLTILSAPGSDGKALPWSSQPSQWGVQPQPLQPVPAKMLAGLRALFRLVPRPADELDRMMVTTLERRVGSGRLVLVDGCFRLDGRTGPIAILPPGTILGLSKGYLMAGPPGLPPELSARIGEHVFWEGDTIRNFDAASLARVKQHCGSGDVQLVRPQSATVQQARNDGHAASNFADRYGVPWRDALQRVRRCRERLEESLPEPRNGAPMVDNMCGSTPPSPVLDPDYCPPGSTLSGGLCRTTEGHIRPVPEV
jgi:hypothetical protein